MFNSEGRPDLATLSLDEINEQVLSKGSATAQTSVGHARAHRPMQVSIIGGEPLIRRNELSRSARYLATTRPRFDLGEEA